MSRRATFVGALAVVAALGSLCVSVRGQTPSQHHTLTFGLRSPVPHDCQVYNPDTVTIEHLESGVWRLQDGPHWIAAFATETEGKNALALAQRFREMCYIGRINGRGGAERGNYIVNYWRGASGRQTTIDPEQCQAYDSAKLHIVNRGAVGWVVTDDAGLTLTLGNWDDAEATLALATDYKMRCTIGKYVNSPGQLRTSRLDYWK